METTRLFQARDGAPVRVTSVGSGPGVVIVHGGGVTSRLYRRLASRLGERLTVHLYDRRGRGDAARRSRGYAIQDDIADVAAVLDGTGATALIGHSVGGYIALRAAQELSVDRLVLYDAAVSIDGLFPSAWLPAARAAADVGDTARALALTSAGINTHQLSSRLPLTVQTGLTRAFLRTALGAQMAELVPSTLEESQEVVDNDGPATRWADVTADVLVAYGASGPRYYAALSRALVSTLPRAQILPVLRHGHDGINRAPRAFVDAVVAFLLS